MNPILRNLDLQFDQRALLHVFVNGTDERQFARSRIHMEIAGVVNVTDDDKPSCMVNVQSEVQQRRTHGRAAHQSHWNVRLDRRDDRRIDHVQRQHANLDRQEGTRRDHTPFDSIGLVIEIHDGECFDLGKGNRALSSSPRASTYIEFVD